MFKQTNNKFLILLVVVLALSNIALLSILIFQKPQSHSKKKYREERMKNFLVKDIGLSASQMATYDALYKTHMQSMEQLFDTMRTGGNQNFELLGKKGFSDSAIDVVVNRSAVQQKIVDQKVLAHFKEIRNICSGEQKARFDSGISKLFFKKEQTKKDK
ncbi:MAG: periplasmic heavy metal sensor [Chitinophagaceae bacterium]|nr:periplasmic heavy metal sensor [Chitinophagaceae bacterium]MBL0254776.1 periplasmic heavy metal sensor [Chitinophagaceae bacterium]